MAGCDHLRVNLRQKGFETFLGLAANFLQAKKYSAHKSYR